MIKISIIMPVYNDADNLNKSITSILNQTIDEIEVICVNDGSTDNSLDVLNEFSKKDSRIKVFTIENSGSGAARNYGISKSSGEYLAFLDSDDYMVDKDALNQLYSEAKKTNMVMVSGGIQFIVNGEILTEVRCFKPIKRLSIKSVGEFCVPWYFYKSIFKRDFVIENNIKFPNLLRGQDPIFFLDILTRIDMYLEVPVLYYSYNSPTENKINDSKKYHDYFVHFYEVFKLITLNDTFRKMIVEYSDFLTTMKNRDIYVHNKQELLNLLGIMDKIKGVFVDYGDETILKKVSKSFDELINKVSIKNLEISVNAYENIGDVYSEGVVIIDKSITPKISFVLPVYNVEEYLCECLDSIVNQTLEDIEIICINDGSTDNSLEILERYAKNDSRISIYTFSNKGLGPSRNRGIKRANGKYVAFVDTDDWVELDFAERIYETAIKNDAEIVLFNAVEEHENFKKERIYFKEGLIDDPDNFIFDFKWNSGFVLDNYFTAWSKLHKLKFLKDNDIEFPATIFEDMEFQVESFLKARKIVYSPNIFYHYRKTNSKSIMNSLHGDDCFCVIDIMQRIGFHIRNYNVYERFEFSFLKLMIKTYMEKFDSLNYVLKCEFFNRIRADFINLNLNETKLSKLHPNLADFYKNVIKFDDYWQYNLYCDNDENEEFTLNKLDEKNHGIVSKNAELINENQLMKAEISDLNKNNVKLLEKNQVMEKKIFNLRNDYEVLLDKNNSLRVEISDLKRNNVKLLEKNQVMEKEIFNLRNDYKVLLDKNNSLCAEIFDLNSMNDNLSKTNGISIKEIESLKKSIKKFEMDISEKDLNLSKLKKDNSNLISITKSQNIKLNHLNDQIYLLKNKNKFINVNEKNSQSKKYVFFKR